MGEEKEIVVLDADEKACRALCELIEERHYRASPAHSLPSLERYLLSHKCLVAILDVNTIPDNRKIRELTLKHPGVYFLGMSGRRFNPELKEAICYHIYACLTKPVDPDELFYWLKSIFHDEAGEGNPSDP